MAALASLLSTISLEPLVVRMAATAFVVVAVSWAAGRFGPIIGGALAGIIRAELARVSQQLERLEAQAVQSEEAARLVRQEGFVMLDQFGNRDNVLAHERTTGPEIWRDTDGEVTHFVSAMGTTGTIMGVSRYLKSRKPAVQIVGTQPAVGSSIPGIRRWSPEFVPAIYQPERVDRLIDVSADAAVAACRRLAREEGVLAGMSAGGALVAALEVVTELRAREASGTVVFIVPDRGERYLSGTLSRSKLRATL